MKVLIVDNNQNNRSRMSDLLAQQKIITIDGLLEAPNRIMGAMLIEAINFDLVILGGMLNNQLPDGTLDTGNGVSLAAQLLERSNAQSNVILWSDNSDVQQQFIQLFAQHQLEYLPHLCWKKSLELNELELNLQLLFQYQSHAAASIHHQEI